jgi:hypothetical protein
MLLAVFVFGVVGTGTELILLEHTEDTLQWIPLILMSLGLVVAAWCAIRPGRTGMRTMQALMALYVASGLVGLYLHYRGNVEFELEMYPSMAGLQLFWESIRGATPTLSPGTMVVLGLVGWVYTFRHPATVRRDRAADANTGAV